MQLIVPRRFCGPPGSGNGGWTAGALASLVPAGGGPPTVSVRLSAPPPLDRPLDVDRSDTPDRPDDATLILRDGDRVVATAITREPLDGEVPATATMAEAEAAAARFEGLASHPFPTCVVCGTARSDGLGLRPGPLDDGTSRYATPWVPDDADLALTWAALDCPGGWSAGIAGRPMVLGTMAATVIRLPVVGAPHVVTAWARGGEGRRFLSGSALHTGEGELLARAEAVWVAVDPATFGAAPPS